MEILSVICRYVVLAPLPVPLQGHLDVTCESVKLDVVHACFQLLERQVELAGASAHAVDLKHRMGRLWERELGEATRAVETYREVLMVDAVHQPTLEALD